MTHKTTVSLLHGAQSCSTRKDRPNSWPTCPGKDAVDGALSAAVCFCSHCLAWATCTYFSASLSSSASGIMYFGGPLGHPSISGGIIQVSRTTTKWITHQTPDSADSFLMGTSGYGHAGCTHYTHEGPERRKNEQKPKMRCWTPKPRKPLLKLAASNSKNSPFYFSETSVWGCEELGLVLHIRDCTVTLSFS